ncbi:hypothetical protein [Pyxidicoccus xibeiensis]|uniref:hypothetical protein n=1 Tax=Pyxidicoccus xibeiensis TaxID=2906759 RepID=UPI0020A6F88A|nr:hypothetical protein [Pyxidicoccus xibeiensis]MCP3142889.1 hypothetical protein [Pyxidicoccus xibeiensis]
MHTLSKRIASTFTLESGPLSTLRSSLVGVCALMVCLSAGTADANCQTFLAPYFNWAAQGASKYVGFTYVSMQGDSRASYVKHTYQNAGSLHYVSATGNLDTRFGASIGYVPVLYSDRYVSGQPFAVSLPDSSDVVVTPTGTVSFISNTWGVTGYLTNPVCLNNVMYGWGPAIGASPTPALYVFQFEKMSDPT